MTEPKNIEKVVDGERCRMALARLVASDEESVFLFRTRNSNYFVQRQGEEGEDLEVLPVKEAEKLYKEPPNKHQGLVNAFPKLHGGIRQDTKTIYDKD